MTVLIMCEGEPRGALACLSRAHTIFSGCSTLRTTGHDTFTLSISRPNDVCSDLVTRSASRGGVKADAYFTNIVPIATAHPPPVCAGSRRWCPEKMTRSGP